MAALRTQFFKAHNLLCIWYFTKNVLANCRNHFRNQQDWETLEAEFKQLCYSIDVSSYKTNWAGICKRYPISVSKYIERTWLCYKDRFILARNKAYRNLGNAASNRAEGQHEAVKSRIAETTVDLADVYQRVLLSVDHQDKVIRHSIAYSRAHTLIAISGDIWANVRRKIPHHALKKAHEEVKKTRVSPSTPCTNVFTSTLGIPCSHRVRDILVKG